MSDDAPVERDPLRLLPEFHRSTRMPLDAVVRLHFEGTVAYQNGFAANVSALGMFVKHPEPPEIGTRLVFEFTIGDERKPVQGGGVVTWVRERYEGPGRPAGVGIQFTELDALSRAHIAEALFEYLETQLGVEVADHPDVPDLLAAIPKSTVVEVADDAAVEPTEPQRELGFEPEPEPSGADAAESKPFRLFGDAAPESDVRLDDLDTPRDELFAPVTPPEPPPYAAETYGAARRRESPAWMPVAIAIAIAALGFATWWFLWGPGGETRQRREPAPAAIEAATPAPAARPRLDPQPGPETTLAEAVGAVPETSAPAPEPEPEPERIAQPSADEPGTAVAPAAAPPPVAGAAATRVREIRWDAAGGGTAVTLVGDGAFRPGSYRWFEMGGERPRVLVRLTGMAGGFPRSTLDVDTAEVAGIRIGYHERPGGNELHVVLDLADPATKVVAVESAGDRLVVQLRR